MFLSISSFFSLQGPSGLKGGEGPQGPPGPVVSFLRSDSQYVLGKKEKEEENAPFLSALNSSLCRLQYLICVIDCHLPQYISCLTEGFVCQAPVGE